MPSLIPSNSCPAPSRAVARAQFRRFLGRTVNRARDRAEVIAQKMSHVRHREERDAFESLDGVADAHTVVRVPVRGMTWERGGCQCKVVEEGDGELYGRYQLLGCQSLACV